MRRLLRTACAALSLCILDVGVAEAQVGPLIDWIHKLSGPKFVQFGTTFSLGYEPGLRLDTAVINWLQANAPARVSGDDLTRLSSLLANAESLPKTYYRAKMVERVHMEARRAMNATTDPARDAHIDRVVPAIVDLLTDIDALDRGSGVRARLSISAGDAVSSDGEIEPDSAAVKVLTISPTVEYLFSRPFAAEVGVNFHRFSGDFDPFWNFSIPVRAVARPFVNHELRLLRAVRANIGFNLFTPFEEEAFLPVSPIAESGWEIVWAGSIGLDIPIEIF